MIISQRLVRSKEGKRVAAVEIYAEHPAHLGADTQGRHQQREGSVQGHERAGMQSFDQALFELYRKGAISMDEALSNADSRSNLEAKINFG